MFALIVNFECEKEVGNKVWKNLTVKEFGEKLVGLSKDYVLVYETCMNHDCLFGEVHLAAVAKRV